MSAAITGAIKALSAEIAGNPEIAWAWHCNIAVPIMDVTGVSHKLANEAAAHLMQHLFDYDITTHEHYAYGKSDAQQYAELRIAAEREEDAAPVGTLPKGRDAKQGPVRSKGDAVIGEAEQAPK